MTSGGLERLSWHLLPHGSEARPGRGATQAKMHVRRLVGRPQGHRTYGRHPHPRAGAFTTLIASIQRCLNARTQTRRPSPFLAFQLWSLLQPDGSPPVKPVGFRYNPGLGTIDVTGFNMATSQKFRNVRRNRQAALAVDDIASADPWRVRFLESRGTVDAIPAPADPRA